MLETILAKIKGFLFNPVGTFRNSRTDETSTVVTCFFTLLIVFAGLGAILQFIFLVLMYLLAAGFSTAATGPQSSEVLAMVFGVPFIAFASVIVMYCILVLVYSILTHLCVYLLGGRSGFFPTFHAVLYSMIPYLLLGWIPIVGIFAFLWTLVLLFFGIREFQELEDSRAAGAVIIPTFLLLVIIAILAVLFLLAIPSGAPYTPSD
jgi:hypothetical protein